MNKSENQIRAAIKSASGMTAHEVAKIASELLPEPVYVCYKDGKLRTAAHSLYDLDLKNRDWTAVARFDRGKRVPINDPIATVDEQGGGGE